MKIRHTASKSILSLAFAIVLTMSFSLQTALAQSGPLSLAEVLTGLQSKSGGFTMSQKNSFITQQIQRRGITFRVSNEIEQELRRAGATFALISAARSRAPRNTPVRNINPNAPPIVEFDKIWVDYNVTVAGKKGMRVHTKFTLKNLKDVQLKLAVRIQRDDGDVLSSKTAAYRNRGGQLEVSKPLKPGFTSAVYKDYSVFLPYDEFAIEPGKHNLKLDADIYYPDGDLLRHLALYPFTFTKPARSTTSTPPTNNGGKPSVKLGRMWIDYDVTQDGQKGMLVHTKATLNNLRGRNLQLALVVQKADGGKITARPNSRNRSVNGSLTFYKDIVPRYDSAVFHDIKVFIPYSEIVLGAGVHKLRLHTDIISPDGKFNLHVNYYPFQFRRRSSSNYN